MSENPEFPHEGDPARAEELHDLPTDFFDDAAEHLPDPSAPMDVLGHAEAGESPHGPHPTSHVPEVEVPPGAPVFPVVLGILMVGVIVVSILVSNMDKGTKESTAATATTPAPTVPDPAAAIEPLAGDVKSLKNDLAKLTGQLEALSAKVAGLPKPPPPPDLKPIQAKLDDLSKSVASVQGVSAKLDQVDAQVKSLEAGVKSTGVKVSALALDVQSASAAAAKAHADAAKAMTAASTPAPAASTPAPASTTAKPEEDKDATSLAQGADLFKAGKYKEADEVFKKLAGASPKDARVYYYAALTNGLTTQDWQNETVKIATQGADLEKSGATKPADIDTAFSGLPENLKPWLVYFRKLGK